MAAAKKVYKMLIKDFGKDNLSSLKILDKNQTKYLGYGEAPATIIWEGGPYNWAVEVSMREDVLALPGVLVEPYNSFILNFYKY